MTRQLELGQDDSVVALQRAWQLALERLADRVNKPSFESWLKTIVPLSLVNGTVTLGTTSRFAKNWVESKYTDLIKEILDENLEINSVIKVELISDEEPALIAEKTASKPSKKKDEPEDEPISLPLNDRYTFDTFVEGVSNRLARASAEAVSEKPGKNYNPLFIYGGPGLGKTHLLHAIGQYAIQHKPGVKVAYVKGETFTYHYITSLREHKTAEFRKKYRNIDIWLVDDIQFLVGKERTEEEFFHTFNALYETKKQVVLTSDKPPKDLQLENRLLSRFECGLIADIAPPDFETRLAILQNKADQEQMYLPVEVAEYIASVARSNIRQIEGALVKLHAYSSLMKQPVTEDLARQILNGYFGEEDEPRLDVKSIQIAVCKRLNVDIEEMNGGKRSREIVTARQVAMYLTRELTESSLPAIGKSFGGKDHTTVLHACTKVKSDIAKDRTLSNLLNEITAQLKNGKN